MGRRNLDRRHPQGRQGTTKASAQTRLTWTPEEIRNAGLDALRERLGVVGMIRFRQQCHPGSGDYAKERHKWLGKLSVDEIVRQIKAQRRRKTGKSWHVIPHAKGWAVRREASTRVRSVHATKREAIKAGRRLVRSAGGELIIHRRDG